MGLSHLMAASGSGPSLAHQDSAIRLRQKRLRQREPGAHPVRVRPHWSPRGRSTNPLDNFLNTPPGRGSGIRAKDLEIFQTCKVVIESGAFENCSDFLQACFRSAVTLKPQICTSPERPNLAEHHSDRGALPAHCAEQPVNLT